MFAVVIDIINFVKESSKRRKALETNLLKMCETRFVQCHDALLRFAAAFQHVVEQGCQTYGPRAGLGPRTGLILSLIHI